MHFVNVGQGVAPQVVNVRFIFAGRDEIAQQVAFPTDASQLNFHLSRLKTCPRELNSRAARRVSMQTAHCVQHLQDAISMHDAADKTWLRWQALLPKHLQQRRKIQGYPRAAINRDG